MTWKLFLDDTRYPQMEHIDPGSVKVARHVKDALDLVEAHGIPDFMYLDYCLGYETSIAFLEALKAKFPDGPIPEYDIISTHPERARIHKFMDEWKNPPEPSIWELPVGTIIEWHTKGKLVRGKVLEMDSRQRYKVLTEKAEGEFVKPGVVYPAQIYAYTPP